MEENKIKVFFGSHVNVPNAQNLNCKALIENLDDTKFECYSLVDSCFSVDYEVIRKRNVHLFVIKKPRILFNVMGFCWGFFKCQILYLPKHDYMRLVKILLFLTKKKSIKTIEIVIDESTFKLVDQKYGLKREKFRNYFKGFTELYSITNYVKNISQKKENLGLTSKGPLFLGTNISSQRPAFVTKNGINEIVFIGIDSKRKGIDDFIELAHRFPDVNFNIIGSQCEEIKVGCANNINLNFLGILEHKKVKDFLSRQDLLILPSRREGFPKIILEAGSLYVPCVLYSNYGMGDFITTGINGFVVDSIDEIQETIKFCKNNIDVFNSIRKESYQLAKKFDWKVVVKQWEVVFEDLYSRS